MNPHGDLVSGSLKQKCMSEITVPQLAASLVSDMRLGGTFPVYRGIDGSRLPLQPNFQERMSVFPSPIRRLNRIPRGLVTQVDFLRESLCPPQLCFLSALEPSRGLAFRTSGSKPTSEHHALTDGYHPPRNLENSLLLSKSNPIAQPQAFSPPEDSVRHYQTEALLCLYTPIAERQGVATHQDQTCPGEPS
ncbi:hypothetical protein EVAR_73749_1 [Eumeta japonica]|uniref:Uncharacterized protein n=1 Tax=Eumeta variegata TaxID=151549 RepID=A0A4C1SF84_EUMVA|nr:hypothetical protein EVAR_73749_1 [Eumeta japonica]